MECRRARPKSPGFHRFVSLRACDRAPRLSARGCAVPSTHDRRVDVAAVVEVHVVRLDRAVALPRAARSRCTTRSCSPVISGMKRATSIGSNGLRMSTTRTPGVEVREHDELLVERRGDTRRRTSAGRTGRRDGRNRRAPRAPGSVEIGSGWRFFRDVEDQQHVARLLAAERLRLRRDEQQIARARVAVVGVVRRSSKP